MIALFQLWALVEVLGVLCLPLSFVVFRNMPDRGWALSKALGMVVFAFSAWLPLMCCRFFPYSRLFLSGILIMLAACSGLAFLKLYPDIVQLVKRHYLYLVIAELLFFSMMTLLGLLRTLNPNIQGFEMFMDEGFVSAIMRSQHLPPNDMWFAGYSINYYYYAHYTVATLAKLLGQSSSVAFNTGISLFYGLTALNLFGVTCNIVAWGRQARHIAAEGKTEQVGVRACPLLRAVPFGGMSVLVGLVLGNLAATQQWWDHHGDGGFHFDWFAPSRVIASTINEFPVFSFILSCFHAHVLTLAFTILCIGLALNCLLEPDGRGLAVFGRGWQLPLNLCITAIVLGGLFTMNGWDYPTYMCLTLVCILLQQYLVHKSWFSLAFFRDIACVGVCLVVLSYVFYLPFYLNFNSPSQGIGLVSPLDHSKLSDELLIYGIFVFGFLSLLLASALKRPLSLRAAEPFGQIATETHSTTMAGDAEPVFACVAHSQEALHSVDSYPPIRQSETLSSSSGVVMGMIKDSGSDHVTSVPDNRVERPSVEHAARQFILIGMSALMLLGATLFKLMPYNATLVVCVALALGGIVLVFYHLKNRAHAFVLLLGASAFVIIAGCEVFYLKDVLTGSNFERMNTVFKFYFQAWALLSICFGAGLFFTLDFLRSVRVKRRIWRWGYRGALGLWCGMLLLLVGAGMVYPIYASYSRYSLVNSLSVFAFLQRDFSLDGMKYLATCQPSECGIATSADYEAMRWINEHISGDPVIVESIGGDYSYSSRVAVFTGLPTPMGWVSHEMQWRVNWIRQLHTDHQQQFDQRVMDINQIYTNPSPAVVLDTMSQYTAQYLYVGPLEYQKYTGANLHRFHSFMKTVYNYAGVTIYMVNMPMAG